MKRNPKQEGSNLLDCRPQIGKCPLNCNQCFYNREGAFYVDINKPNIVTKKESIGYIIRMNCGHDSNIEREKVINTAKKYKDYFFNTSIPRFDFPNPVVFTANPKERYPAHLISSENIPNNLMFVRLRVSSTNFNHIERAINHYCCKLNIPVVLTFMAYYEEHAIPDKTNYEWKTRHINSYWCPKKEFIKKTFLRFRKIGGFLVDLCGTFNSNYCRDCRNCENYYRQRKKFLVEMGSR